MDTRECQTCDYWKFTTANYGECRKYPPLIAPAHLEKRSEVAALGWWPITTAEDWCGMYQLVPADPAPAEPKGT